MGLINRLLGSTAAPTLPEPLAARLAAWRTQREDDPQLSLLRSRCVIIDIATDGLDPETHTVQSLAVLGMRQGVVSGRDVLLLENLPELVRAGDCKLLEALVAVLEHVGGSPLVTWQAPFIGRFLQKLYEAYLGLSYTPVWIDLAVVLPELLGERGPQSNRFDAWLAHFGIDVPGRLAALPDTLGMARLLQMALAEASRRGIDSAARLRQMESQRRWLGR